VPLGILSALEPCGAILCANLPIIYREIAKGLKRIGGTARTPGGVSDDSNKELSSPYKASRGHDWIRINNSGRKNETEFPKTSIAGGKTGESEQELTKRGGIKVEREFELQSRGSTNHSNNDMLV
jgi:hypothetical protein